MTMLLIEKEEEEISLQKKRRCGCIRGLSLNWGQSVSVSPLLAVDGLARKSFSFSYRKLPQEPLNLTVMKLDGSSFGIEVMNGATVLELRQAVENAFSHVPKKGPLKVSWPHVWTHFCLSYEGQTLIRETGYIRDYGMKDGDQLRFVRHVSVRFYNATRKKRSRKQHCTKLLTLSDEEGERKDESPMASASPNESRRETKEDVFSDYAYSVDIENQLSDYKEEEPIRQDTPGLGHFLRGWLSYSRLMPIETADTKAHPSKLTVGLFRKVGKLLWLHNDRPYYKKEKLRLE